MSLPIEHPFYDLDESRVSEIRNDILTNYMAYIEPAEYVLVNDYRLGSMKTEDFLMHYMAVLDVFDKVRLRQEGRQPVIWVYQP